MIVELTQKDAERLIGLIEQADPQHRDQNFGWLHWLLRSRLEIADWQRDSVRTGVTTWRRLTQDCHPEEKGLYLVAPDEDPCNVSVKAWDGESCPMLELMIGAFPIV